MIDTSVKHALQLSIGEFNEWAGGANYQKHSYSDLKGIFFNKLIKNLTGTPYLPDYWSKKAYDPSFIEKFVIHEGRIIELSFATQKSSLSESQKVIDLLNSAVDDIDFDCIIGITNFSKRIESFKIPK